MPLPPRRCLRLAASGLTTVALLAACGQKGDLYIPATPAAAQRATLPQTVFGGSGGAAQRPATQPPAAPPPLPDLPDAQ